uniref:Uncharacterized protein n=1 Tax=Anguilla anguilla TaxID=7936 RepID=A0A0E9TTT0_ANGAN
MEMKYMNSNYIFLYIAILHKIYGQIYVTDTFRYCWEI